MDVRAKERRARSRQRRELSTTEEGATEASDDLVLRSNKVVDIGHGDDPGEGAQRRKRRKGGKRRKDKERRHAVELRDDADLQRIEKRLRAGDDGDDIAAMLLKRGYSEQDAKELGERYDRQFQDQLRARPGGEVESEEVGARRGGGVGNIIFGALFIAGGASGQFVLKGTDSSIGLLLLGVALVGVGFFRIRASRG